MLKNVIIAYQKLGELAGFASYNRLRVAHREVVNELLANGNNHRQIHWTESVAVGSKNFIETIKEKLGRLVKGRKILENDGGLHLREETATYIANYDIENDNIGDENTYFWDINLLLSIG